MKFCPEPNKNAFEHHAQNNQEFALMSKGEPVLLTWNRCDSAQKQWQGGQRMVESQNLGSFSTYSLSMYASGRHFRTTKFSQSSHFSVASQVARWLQPKSQVFQEYHPPESERPGVSVPGVPEYDRPGVLVPGVLVGGREERRDQNDVYPVSRC